MHVQVHTMHMDAHAGTRVHMMHTDTHENPHGRTTHGSIRTHVSAHKHECMHTHASSSPV